MTAGDNHPLDRASEVSARSRNTSPGGAAPHELRAAELVRVCVRRPKGVESRASRLSHSLPPLIGVLVIAATQQPASIFGLRVFPFGIASYASGFVMVALGLAFTVWARVHLGVNWSASVARKLDPQLVRSGPYAWVRHPIYSGLLLAFLGVAVGRGDVFALLGCGLMWYGYLRKLRIEERWRQQTFGDAYVRYRDEVPGLVPWPSAVRRAKKFGRQGLNDDR